MSDTEPRPVQSLPVIHQTERLRRFFGATVDPAFVRGRAETISGYIGQRPSYTDPTRDFYLAEPTAARSFYQLEPAMVQADAGGVALRALPYEDLVGWLASQGADTTNHERLFEAPYYTWAPPIDVDKINNPRLYLWFGDNPDALPTLPLIAPMRLHLGDGTERRFTMPSRLASDSTGAAETPSVLVRAHSLAELVPVSFSRDGNDLILDQAPMAGANIVVFRYGDLRPLLVGATSLDLSGLNAGALTRRFVGDGERTRFALPASQHGGGGVAAALIDGVPVSVLPAGDDVILSAVPAVGSEVVTIRHGWLASYIRFQAAVGSQPSTMPSLTSGMRVTLVDATTLAASAATASDRFFVEGVGRAIRLASESRMIPVVRPEYRTIERDSFDNNPWSRRNWWVHRDSIAWARGSSAVDRRASRPIIEFLRDLRLFDYGTRRLDQVDAIVTAGHFVSVAEFDRSPFDLESETVPPNVPPEFRSSFDGTVFYRLTDVLPPDNIFTDNGDPFDRNRWTRLRDGMRLLVTQAEGLLPALANRIFRVNVIEDNGNATVVLTPEPDLPVAGDMVELRDGPAAGDEFWFDGTIWHPAQRWSNAATEDGDPRFQLFDAEGALLTDPARYPDSDFQGSRIFGFAGGSGLADAILRRPIQRDARGQIRFEHDAATRRMTWRDGTYAGLHLHEFRPVEGPPSFSSTWLPVAGNLRQPRDPVTGLHVIPQNLQANPDNEDVGFVSRADFFEQFRDIVEQQSGFDPLVHRAFGANNFRDSPKNIALGDRILQHAAPLLRLMLHASASEFDPLAALRWAEAEYARFRVKFQRRTITLLNDGGLRMGADGREWAEAVLTAMRRERSPDFPFANSPVGGGWFIPPTPALLGLVPLRRPRVEVDDTYAEPVSFLVGHDGSRTPLFGDERDITMLALEELIYEAAPERFKTERRPDFDLDAFIDGRFNAAQVDTYGRADLARMENQHFLRWVQATGFDWRTNNGWSGADPFSWNWRGHPDRWGRPLAGNWRAIYRDFFGTDHPHTAPWEMLGFVEQPAWWTDQYGEAPYTSGNLPLWEDIRDGVIRQGPRAGTHARLARPDLFDVLPVDEAGRLLDPLAARITLYAPSVQITTRPWDVGDHGPVENLWRISTYFGFAKVAVGLLAKPARAMEYGWDTLGTGNFDAQRLRLDTLARQRHGALRVHAEADPLTDERVVGFGIQTFVSEYLISLGRSPSVFGDAVRGLSVRLSHKMAGFTSRDDLRVLADDFGLVPAEDTDIVLHQSPIIRSEFYSGVIIEWVGDGWRVVGYDIRDPAFTIIPGDAAGPKGVLSLSTTPEPVVLEWRPNTYYAIGVIVSFEGQTYRAQRSHTSSTSFESQFWSPAPQAAQRAPRVITYLRGVPEDVMRVPYGSILRSRQEVADFLLGYERWLQARGWVFEDRDPSTQIVRDWSQAVIEFLGWAQVDWEVGNFVALSPAARQLRFFAEQGTIYGVETGGFGLLDREGRPITRRRNEVSRLDGDIVFRPIETDIFGARLGVGEVEHLLLFSNRTIFGDTIYAPLFNLRQPRLRLSGRRGPDWRGRLDAQGYIVDGDTLLPNFDRQAENVREAFSIEQAEQVNLRDYARHLAGFQNRPYLDDLLLAPTEQFEFHQGLIQSKGSGGAFERLLRSERISADRDIRFLEDWAIREARFGAPRRRYMSFLLNDSDVTGNPQFISFTPIERAPLGWLMLNGQDDVRLIDAPPSAAAFFPQRPTAWAASRDYQIDQKVTFDGRIWLAREQHISGTTFERRFWQEQDAGEISLPTPGHVRLSEVNYTVRSRGDLSSLIRTLADAELRVQDGERIWSYGMRGIARVQEPWDVLRVAPLPSTARSIVRAESQATNPAARDLRLVLDGPHGLDPASFPPSEANAEALRRRPLILVQPLEGGDEPVFAGVHAIRRVGTTNGEAWIEVDAPPNDEDFTEGELPAIRMLATVRFPSETDTTTLLPLVAGDFRWIDGSPWRVQRFTGSAWVTHRVEPLNSRPDANAVREIRLFDIGTRITGNRLDWQPEIINRINIVDPSNGIIPGIVDREITYKTDFDPARYGTGPDGNSDIVWGAEHVGELWWDLSEVRFIEALSDEITNDNGRTVAEIRHRTENWIRVAPGTAITLWEWVSSDVPPQDWGGDGAVRFDPSWTERRTLDRLTGTETVRYHFWVGNRTVVPRGIANRRTAANSLARLIENPSAQNLPWAAPILSNGLLVGGLTGLNNVSTALAIDLDNAGNEVRHDQWALLRPNDDRTRVPNWLWTRIADGLAGADIRNTPVPDYAPLASNATTEQKARWEQIVRVRYTGIDEGQSIFFPSHDGSGRRSARRSFVDVVNAILSIEPLNKNRSLGVSRLRAEEPADEFLIWTQPDESVVVIPPPDEPFARIVHEDPRDLPGIVGERILVDRLSAARPQWSVWTRTVDRWVPARNFDHRVSSFAERDALAATILPNERVLVEGVPQTGGLWTIWRRENARWVLARAQRFKTSDFIEDVDWYASTYQPSRPPVVSYADAIARDAVEGDTPLTRFVRLNNDGFGRWVWTAFVDGAWIVVARERGTIRLSERLYTQVGVITTTNDGLNDPIPNLGMRDPGRDVAVILDVLRTSLLTPLEATTVFFSLMHFLHTQQDGVDWAFKTSFLSLAGYGEELIQRPITTRDITEGLLAYIEEVKPYRVKTRAVLSRVTFGPDDARLRVTDFDKPPYRDPDTAEVRRLDPRAPRDASLFQPREEAFSGEPLLFRRTTWQEWLENNGVNDLGVQDWPQERSPAVAPVRRMLVRMSFARLGMEMERVDAWAPNRFYERGAFVTYAGKTHRAKSAHTSGTLFVYALWAPAHRNIRRAAGEAGISENRALVTLGLAFNGVEYSGGGVEMPETVDVLDGNGTSLALNPDPGLQGRDPYHDADRAEERVSFVADDYLLMRLRTAPTQGAPPQAQRFHVARETGSTEYDIGLLPEQQNSVIVYRNGMRVLGNPPIDHFGRTSTLDASRHDRLLFHSFGSGGAVVHARWLRRAVNRETVYVLSDGRNWLPAWGSPVIEVTVDGVPTSRFTHVADEFVATRGQLGFDQERPDVANVGVRVVRSRTIALLDRPANNADVMITVRRVADGATNEPQAVPVYTRLDPTPSNSWSLPHRSFGAFPEHGATIVEVNGARLTPPVSAFATMEFNEDTPASGTNFVELPFVPTDFGNVEVWYRPQGASEHVLYDRELLDVGLSSLGEAISARSGFAGLPMEVLRFDHDPLPQFIIHEGYIVCIDPALDCAEVVVVIKERHEYDVDTDGTLIVLPPLPNNARIEVTTFSDAPRWGIRTWVHFGNSVGRYPLDRLADQCAPEHPSLPRTLDYVWLTRNARREAPDVDFTIERQDEAVGFDQVPFDTSAFDEFERRGVVVVPPSDNATVPIVTTLFRGRPAREHLDWAILDVGQPLIGFDTLPFTAEPLDAQPDTRQYLKLRPLTPMVLAQDLSPSDSFLVVETRPDPLVPPEFIDPEPLIVPDPARGVIGVCFVAGERIEYTTLTRTGTRFMLSGLRRRTRGTSRGDERRVVRTYPANGTLASFSLPVEDAEATVDVTLWPLAQQGSNNPHRIIRLVNRLDYTVAMQQGTTTVTLNEAPPDGWFVTIGMTRTPLHPAGTSVFDGSDVLSRAVIRTEDRHDLVVRGALADGR